MLKENQAQLQGGTGIATAAGATMPMPKQATEVEQEQYNQLMGAYLQLTYPEDKPDATKRIAKAIQKGGDQGLATVAAEQAFHVFRRAKEAEMAFSPDAKTAAAKEMFEDMADIARELNIKDYSKDKKALAGAYIQYVDTLRSRLQQAGMIPQARAEDSFQRMQQMDQTGGLERFFMDLSQRDRGGMA